MSLSNAKKLVEKLAKDSKFKEAFLVEAKKGDKNAVIAFAKKSGLECTAEELKEVFGGGHHSLTKDDLKNLSGGSCCCWRRVGK